MNKSVIAGIVIVGILAAAGGGYWFGQQRAAPAPGALPRRRLAVPRRAPAKAAGAPGGGGAPPSRRSRSTTAPMAKSITAVGSLRSDESITVRPEIAGRVAVIGFQEGQRVPKGATLVRLDPAINQAEVQQAQANLTLARAKYERASELRPRGSSPGRPGTRPRTT